MARIQIAKVVVIVGLAGSLLAIYEAWTRISRPGWPPQAFTKGTENASADLPPERVRGMMEYRTLQKAAKDGLEIVEGKRAPTQEESEAARNLGEDFERALEYILVDWWTESDWSVSDRNKVQDRLFEILEKPERKGSDTAPGAVTETVAKTTDPPPPPSQRRTFSTETGWRGPATKRHGDGELDSGDSRLRHSMTYSARVDEAGTGIEVEITYEVREYHKDQRRRKDSHYAVESKFHYPNVAKGERLTLHSPVEGAKTFWQTNEHHGELTNFNSFGILQDVRVRADRSGGKDDSNMAWRARLVIDYSVI